MTIFKFVCLSDSTDDPESVFCPAIRAAVSSQTTAGGEEGGLPLPMIAGGAGATSNLQTLIQNHHY